MDNNFVYHKSPNSFIEIKDEDIEKMEMPIIGKDSVDFLEVPYNVYDDPKWIEKGNSIKARDNYTCQLCHTFNPSQNRYIFIKQGDYETMHHYRDNSVYDIIVDDYGLNISFEFGYGHHLVMPRLNVHHKVYFRNRDIWDYQDDQLITLCENCHHYIHSLDNIMIPIVKEDENKHVKLVGIKPPIPYNKCLDHTDLSTFRPFAVVKENQWGDGLKGQDLIDFKQAKCDNKKWYDYVDCLDRYAVHITYLMYLGRLHNKHSEEEIHQVADFIVNDFIENYLGYSKVPKQQV